MLNSTGKHQAGRQARELKDMETRPGWWGDGVLLCVKTGSTNSGVCGGWYVGTPMFRCVLSKMKSGKSVFWGGHLFSLFFSKVGGWFCRDSVAPAKFVCVSSSILYIPTRRCVCPPRVLSPFSLTNSASLPPHQHWLYIAVVWKLLLLLSLSLSLWFVIFSFALLAARRQREA